MPPALMPEQYTYAPFASMKPTANRATLKV
jgi:hypothetical protein